MRRFPRFDFHLELCKSLWIFLSQKELCSIFLDQDIWLPLNHSWLFLLTLTESQFASGGFIGYFSAQKLSEQLDFFLRYAALLLMFLDFFHELLQNYLLL